MSAERSKLQSQSSSLDEVIFTFPFPPSVNESLAVIRGRLVKTSKSRKFFQEAAEAARGDQFRSARRSVTSWIHEQHCLRVDCLFVWPKDRLFTKGKTAKHWIRQIDAANRVKQLHDALAIELGVDDMYFFAGNAEKIYSEEHDSPFCIVRIQPMKPRSINDLDLKIGQEWTQESNSAKTR